MKRFVSVVIIASFMFVGCADKIQTARISSAAIEAGSNMAKTGLASALSLRYKYCLDKYRAETEPEFVKCYKESKEYKGWIFYQKLHPQIFQAVQTLNSVIDAAEQSGKGATVDFVTPITNAVCLLTQVFDWLPEKWKAQVKIYVNMVGQFTCSGKTSYNPNIHNLKTAKQLRNILLTV